MISPYSSLFIVPTQASGASSTMPKKNSLHVFAPVDHSKTRLQKHSISELIGSTLAQSNSIDQPNNKDEPLIPLNCLSHSIASYLPKALQEMVDLLQPANCQLKEREHQQILQPISVDNRQGQPGNCGRAKIRDPVMVSQPTVSAALEGRLDKLYQIRRAALTPMYSSSYDLQIAATISQKIRALEGDFINLPNEPVELCIIVNCDQYQFCRS